MSHKRIVKLCITAMLAALVCVATAFFIIPTPMGGYIHLGDSFVLMCGWILGPVYGFAAGAIGSAMADIFSGFAIFAPVTFVIKGCMALAAAVIAKKLTEKGFKTFSAHIIGAITAEVIMTAGYYLADALLMGYGFIGALEGVVWSAVQGAAGIIVGVAMIAVISRTKVLSKMETYVI